MYDAVDFLQRRLGAAVDRGADDAADAVVRQKQVVVDDAPALLRGVDHAQAQPRQLGLVRRADPGDAARQPSRQREGAVVGGGDQRDLSLCSRRAMQIHQAT